jgi:hypothetical protein
MSRPRDGSCRAGRNRRVDPCGRRAGRGVTHLHAATAGRSSQEDPLSFPINIPLPRLQARPIRIEGTIRSTYKGRVGANHVFAMSDRLRTQPFVVDQPADGLDKVEFAIESDDIAGKVVMTPDGRALSVANNSSMTFLLTFTTSLSDGQQARFTLRMPLVQSIRTRRQEP